jgi:hypothetical protein
VATYTHPARRGHAGQGDAGDGREAEGLGEAGGEEGEGEERVVGFEAAEGVGGGAVVVGGGWWRDVGEEFAAQAVLAAGRGGDVVEDLGEGDAAGLEAGRWLVSRRRVGGMVVCVCG